MQNRTTLEGNLTQDPKTDTGKYGLWALFTLATTTYYNKQEFTQFISCSASGKTAEIIANFKKGDRLLTFGKVKGRWDKDKKRSDVKVDVKAVYLLSQALKEARGLTTSEEKQEKVSRDDLPF